jgi:hypothetical protein
VPRSNTNPEARDLGARRQLRFSGKNSAAGNSANFQSRLADPHGAIARARATAFRDRVRNAPAAPVSSTFVGAR